LSTVPTAGGAIDIGALGRTLMHEHVFVLSTDVQQNYPYEWDEEIRVADAVAKLAALKSAGIDSILDPTVVGLGRYIPRIVRVAAKVELHIVVATGIYTYDDVPGFFRMRGRGAHPDLAEPMVEMFVRDLTEGIAGTDVRAGFLKCAIDVPGLTPGVERVLRAVAKAHLATGAPVMVHTAPRRRTGLEVHRVLTAEGVDPHRVLLAHSGDSSDADHLCALADLGYLLGMDRFGLDLIAPFDDRVSVVVEMVRRGYAQHMALSHDAACYVDWFDPAVLAAQRNWHFTHITDDVLPALRDRGVGDADIDTMLVDNPRRWFAPGS
jgi:phosphotriesterase-related protein